MTTPARPFQFVFALYSRNLTRAALRMTRLPSAWSGASLLSCGPTRGLKHQPCINFLPAACAVARVRRSARVNFSDELQRLQPSFRASDRRIGTQQLDCSNLLDVREDLDWHRTVARRFLEERAEGHTEHCRDLLEAARARAV